MSEISDLSKLCIHTITTKPWSLQQACEKYSAKGIKGISVWRETLETQSLADSKKMLDDNGMVPVSLIRGGFFTGSEQDRQEATDINKAAIDEAAAIGTPLIVLVCGATPGQSVKENITQIAAGIEAVLPYAEAANIKLGIEPLHPMYGDTRSAIVTMKMANDMAERINSDFLGVTVDVYHLWWELELEQEIRRCGKNDHLFSFHICDWKLDMTDMLQDRGLMGEGIINIKEIRQWVENTGFSGYNEVEIFSKIYWAMDQDDYLEMIIEAYLNKS